MNVLTGVRRTSFQKWIYQKLISYSLTDIRFGDNVPQILSIILSKRRRFNEEYLVRDLSSLHNINGDVVRSESSSFIYPHAIDYCLDKLMSRKLSSLSSLVSDMFNDFDNVNYVDKRECINLTTLCLLRLFGLENYKYPVFKILFSSKILYAVYKKTIFPINNHIRASKISIPKNMADANPAENNIVNIAEATIVSLVISLTSNNHKDDVSIFAMVNCPLLDN